MTDSSLALIEVRLAAIERDQPHGQRLELVRDLRTLITRIKQMEEALREIAEMQAEPVKPNGQTCIEVARAALSPSDTEEATE